MNRTVIVTLDMEKQGKGAFYAYKDEKGAAIFTFWARDGMGVEFPDKIKVTIEPKESGKIQLPDAPKA